MAGRLIRDTSILAIYSLSEHKVRYFYYPSILTPVDLKDYSPKPTTTTTSTETSTPTNVAGVDSSTQTKKEEEGGINALLVGGIIGGLLVFGGGVAAAIAYKRRKTKIDQPVMSEFMDPEVEIYGVNPLYEAQQRFTNNPLLPDNDDSFDRKV